MVKLDISDVQLQYLYDVGVCGVWFNFVKWLVDVLFFDGLKFIVECIKYMGWYIVIYFEVQELVELYDFFIVLFIIVVVDYMGWFDVSKLVDGLEFQLFVKLMCENENFWFKVICLECLLLQGLFYYNDVVFFVCSIVEVFL